MVFESLVSDLLNRFIGDYVENLDKSQLKIGIWGGNVVLENLRVKENALSELDVPFKVKAGQVGRLTLKIPWKNLYTEAVVATLDGLYLLVVPGATIKYDAAKEERYQQEAKQRELQRIEDALHLAARKGSQVGEFVFDLESLVYKDVSRDKGRKVKKPKRPFRRSRKREQKPEKPREEKKDTFAEKLATQVIKNLQIKVTSLHIRYEDDVTDPRRPLSMGVTLSELSLQTTDESWRACILNEAAKMIYKLGRLECLCAYWNVDSPIFYRGSLEEIVVELKAGICTQDEALKGYQYIFRPIVASAKMCIRPNSEIELNTPKISLQLEVQNVAVEVTKPQYMSMVNLLEAIDCMSKNGPYRKFRPDVRVHNHAKQWWLYGINSVLEVHIRRFNQMWSWSHIRKHRRTLKAYKAAYKARLTQSKEKEEMDKQITDLEKVLDVFNITLARQQAQMEVFRSGQKVSTKKVAPQKQGGRRGFFSTFFGGKEGKKKEEEEEEEEREDERLDALMTPEEKRKFYTAIGYSESLHNLALPKSYVAAQINFKLLRTSVTVREEANVPEILKIQMIDLCTTVSQRPGAQAIKVEASLEHWYVTGLRQQGVVPSLIASVGDSRSSLLSILFELNPEDSSADQLLRVRSQPVEIIYDALTVNSLAEFLKAGKGVDLEVITSATLSKLEEIKEKTAVGLSHIIETRKVLDLRVDLKPSYLVVPTSGFYHAAADLVIVDFGHLQLNSIGQAGPQLGSSFSSLEEIMDRAYERFSLELRGVQVLYSEAGDPWRSARSRGSSAQHVLRPMEFVLQLAKCMVEKDSRMPRFKVSGELPLLHVRLSDQKIRGIFQLADSIPLPHTSPPSTPTGRLHTPAHALPGARPRVLSLEPSALPYPVDTDSEDDASERSPPSEDLTDVQFGFEVKSVLLELTQQVAQEHTVLALNITQLGTKGKLRTYDLTVTSYLRTVSLDYCGGGVVPNQTLHLISSSDKHGSDLLKVEYTKADLRGPSFQSLFESTEQMLKVEFSSLDFLLHTEALLSSLNYLTAVLPSELTTSREREPGPRVAAGVSPLVCKSGRDSGAVSFKLCATLDSVGAVVCNDKASIADIRIKGINASVVVQGAEMEVFAQLLDIMVLDVDPRSIHKKVVSIVGEEVFSLKVGVFPGATAGNGYSDTSVVDSKATLRLGRIQIIYLHKFFVSLMAFVNGFQAAKVALSAATASGVRDLARKSFRLSLDVRLEAPLVVIPRSSTSHEAVVVDLGLITVGNSFSLLPAEGFPLPAVMETVEVQLTRLQLSRTLLEHDVPQPGMELLRPMNLELLLKRNLGASWFTKVPGLEVRGGLKAVDVTLGQEDLAVLMSVLSENVGEGGRIGSPHGEEPASEGIPEQTEEARDVLPAEAGRVSTLPDGNPGNENVISILLHFEITEVLVTLVKTKMGSEGPFLVLHASQLGVQTKVRRHDMEATTYIRTISMKCLEFPDSTGDPLCILSSSAKQGAELLKVEYIKADRTGPSFTTTFESTEQRLDVTFSSLDLTLHTEALLSSMDFLSTALSSSTFHSVERTTKRGEESKPNPALQAIRGRSAVASTPGNGDITDLKIGMQLGAFNVLVCDQRSKMADIRIQGLHGSLLMQGTQTHILTRLQDFVIIDVDPNTIHKKTVSIMGDEVFSFSLSLFPNATEGLGYTDTSKVDGKVKLSVGCIQVVYLHKFVLSLLNFSNNFQTAKEVVSTATAQVAVKAASSVRDFAQKSFRLSMDVRLKAPVIVFPQSSTSRHAVEADLGLLTVSNSFSLLPVEDCPLPAVIDNVDVELTRLKLTRVFVEEERNRPGSELLRPINLVLTVKRNLAAAWYHKMAAVEVDGDLKPMEVALSQDDLTVLLKILTENIGEEPPSSSIRPTVVPDRGGVAAGEGSKQLVESVMFWFAVDSLGLVLYADDAQQPGTHQESLCLAEFKLCRMTASGKMFDNGDLEVSTVLTACTLDDRRSGLKRVTSRMLGRREEEGTDAMVDVTYSQRGGECSTVAVLQKLCLCASMEFLMAVAEFFLQALPQKQLAPLDKPGRQMLRPTSEPKDQSRTRTAPAKKTALRAVIVDPEVVFVANLMEADAPALVVSFHCDVKFDSQEAVQLLRANVKELKVLACPFIRSKDKAVTTVLRPCSVVLEAKMLHGATLSGSVTMEEVIVKVSPFILNTVLTITAAMAPKGQEEPLAPRSEELSSLWAPKNIYTCDYWFLGVESAEEVTESFRQVDAGRGGESFNMEVKVVQVTLESGQGHRTTPLLLAESSFRGHAQDWSSGLSMSADLTLEVNYFNEAHAVWEPLIERVEGGKRRWNLTLELKNRPAPGDDSVVAASSDPRTVVNICSNDTMNITLSKCCLNVFRDLAQAFSEGTASSFDHSIKDKAPFVIHNALGVTLIVQHGANLRAADSTSRGNVHEVAMSESVDLEYSIFESSARGRRSALERQESCLFNLSIVPTGFTEIANIPLDNPGRRLYNVRKPGLDESVSVLLQTSASEGRKVITVRSPLQIKNHFSVPFDVLKFCLELGGLVKVGIAEPEKECHVTLDAYRCQLFLLPVGTVQGQYHESTTCIAWKEQVHVSSEVRSVLRCPAWDASLLPLVVNTIAVPDDLCHIASHGEGDWDPAYVIHLHPAVTIRNLLPYSIRYLLEGSAEVHELQEGSAADILNAVISGELLEMALVKYQGQNWTGHIRIDSDMPEFFPVCFASEAREQVTVDVYVHVARGAGQLVLSIFSHYWIINKTSRVLQYQAEDVSVKHPSDFRDVVLFSFKKRNIFSKNKLQICVSTSSWSEGFSLDTVGSYGCVRCPDKAMDYLVGVSIQMSSFNLTRIVTMSPFYTLANKSSYELEVGEVQNGAGNGNIGGKWHYIPSSECLPLWPESRTGKLCIRVVGSESVSRSFFFDKQDSGTLLSMEQYGGIMVDINISDHSTVISFTDYYDGAAPALLVNHTPCLTVSVRQSGCETSWELKPGEAQRFAWDDPAGQRKLCWICHGHSGEVDLIKDEYGQFAYDGLAFVHWVSFLDGRQRVLLFTEDVAVVTKARHAEELEQSQQEVNISLQTLGLSLVNNDNRHEIAYVGITSSGVVWEMRPKNRWRSFNRKNIGLLEKAYQNHIGAKPEPDWVKLETGLEVNFAKVPMLMRYPYPSPIRRNFLPGIRVELKQSPHQRSLRAQLHWLQVDNQLKGAIFPIIFHPVHPPKSIALDSEPKPFVDVSIITRFNEHSRVTQFKYFMVLVQEMAVKIDQGFLGAILALFALPDDPQADGQKTKLIEKDLESLRAQLMESTTTDASGLTFFEHFHISPIKLHLSLSLGCSGSDDPEEADLLPIQSLHLLLQSIGATLTDVDDLVFKLAFFEVRYRFYRRDKLTRAVVRHYTEQFLKQMYVLVLGLDVLGNPFGLIRGLSEGVEAFFYEPFQGAVQGPEEFAEGFVIGVRSLLGHTVGGAAGMVSRITGSVGKGLAAMTMDKEYQQKRREEMNRPPKDFGQSLAKGGKGLLKGVVGGVTGIVTKPVEGAKKEGAAGFFKGIGKGLVGVVARPTGGIVDMASSTFQGIQRAAESTEEVTRLRPVRLIREDGIVRPYDQQESEGYDLFQRSEIKQLDGEVFRERYQYPGHRNANIFITNRRVICVKEFDLIGHFRKEWECQFEHFLRAPLVDGGDLRIYCKDQNRLKLLKDTPGQVRVLDLREARLAEKLRRAILDAQLAHQQHRMVRQKSQRFVKTQQGDSRA